VVLNRNQMHVAGNGATQYYPGLSLLHTQGRLRFARSARLASTTVACRMVTGVRWNGRSPSLSHRLGTHFNPSDWPGTCVTAC
jgi:hypothetical protein